MQPTIDEKTFIFEKKAFEVFVRKIHIATGILVIGSQRVNKQSEDFRCD